MLLQQLSRNLRLILQETWVKGRSSCRPAILLAVAASWLLPHLSHRTSQQTRPFAFGVSCSGLPARHALDLPRLRRHIGDTLCRDRNLIILPGRASDAKDRKRGVSGNAREGNIAFSPSTSPRQLHQIRILIRSEFTAVTEP